MKKKTTLVLTVVDGWQFNPGVGTVIFTASRDITSASLLVTPLTLTVTFGRSVADQMPTTWLPPLSRCDSGTCNAIECTA